jgi:hypothetical protein
MCTEKNCEDIPVLKEKLYFLISFLAYETMDVQAAKKYVKAPKVGGGTAPLVRQQQPLGNPSKRARTGDRAADPPPGIAQLSTSGVYLLIEIGYNIYKKKNW